MLSTSVPRSSNHPTEKHRRRRIWESASPPSSPQTSLPEPDLDTSARFTAYSDTIVNAFRNLSEDLVIVLLTPIVPHPSDSEIQDHNVDPFETFGRALSRHHQRIRHIPYIPEHSLDDAHRNFLQRAGAVMVVCCEPRLSPVESSSRPGTQSSTFTTILNHQIKFASDVRKVLQVLSAGAKVPLIIATTGPEHGLLAQGQGLEEFDAVTYCTYQSWALEDLADWLYDVHRSDCHSLGIEQRTQALRIGQQEADEEDSD